MPYSSVIGIDLGGTKTAVARMDALTHEVQAIEIFPTNAARGFPDVLADVVSTVQRLRATDTVAVGLGVPGVIDRVTHRILTLPNIPGAAGCDPRYEIAKVTGLPASIDNDARCFTFAEAKLGAGKGKKVVVGMTLGTGVGGGIVVDGKIFEGAHGFAAELGHMLLVPGSPPYDSVDKRGDAEQFLSGTAMGRRCAAAKKPEEYLEGEVCGFMQPDIFREVAWLVTSITHCIDPDIVIFGGSSGRALGPHLPAIRTELALWMLPSVPCPELAIGILEHAAVIGAAMRAL